MATIYFVIVCKELKIAQISEINQLLQLLNWFCAYGDAFYGLSHMLMSKNIDNDVSKDSPISMGYLAINEWGWVGYEELSRSRRVLSTETEGRGG